MCVCVMYSDMYAYMCASVCLCALSKKEFNVCIYLTHAQVKCEFCGVKYSVSKDEIRSQILALSSD